MKAVLALAVLFASLVTTSARASEADGYDIDFSKPLTCDTDSKYDISPGIKTIFLDPANASATIESVVSALLFNRKETKGSLILQSEAPAQSVLNAGASKLFVLNKVKIEIAQHSSCRYSAFAGGCSGEEIRARVFQADGSTVDATCSNVQ